MFSYTTQKSKNEEMEAHYEFNIGETRKAIKQSSLSINSKGRKNSVLHLLYVESSWEIWKNNRSHKRQEYITGTGNPPIPVLTYQVIQPLLPISLNISTISICADWIGMNHYRTWKSLKRIKYRLLYLDSVKN